jgi:hypothetical protein
MPYANILDRRKNAEQADETVAAVSRQIFDDDVANGAGCHAFNFGSLERVVGVECNQVVTRDLGVQSLDVADQSVFAVSPEMDAVVVWPHPRGAESDCFDVKLSRFRQAHMVGFCIQQVQIG